MSTSSSQFSLFDNSEDGQETDGSAIRVVEVLASSKPVGKAQAAFSRLVEKIERQRERLKTWQAYGDRYNQRLASELRPLEQEFHQARRSMALLLEELLVQPHGPKDKKQRATLRQMLLELIQDMLLVQDDPELEALHDKHSDIPHAQEREEGLAATRAMVQDVLGMDADTLSTAKNEEELLEQMVQKMQEQMRGDADEQAKPRRTNAKAQAAQAKREQAAQEVSQSVREVYRKLASALHPDREPDPELRKRKTEQMQRVNQAYEAGHLLDLLSLQLEIEQIDASHLSNLPPQRLTHYNQVLREQLAEIEAEIHALVMPLCAAAQISYFSGLAPHAIDQSLSAAIAHTRTDIAAIHADMAAFKDPKVLRQALKQYKASADYDDYGMDDDMDVFEALAELAKISSPPKPTSRRPRSK